MTSLVRKLVYSLFAAVVGWICGFFYYAVIHGFFSHWGQIVVSLGPILFWSAAFVFASWSIFVVPIIAAFPEAHKIFNIQFTPFLAGGYWTLAFIVLVGWWTGWWASPILLSYSFIVGLAAGFVYAVLMRKNRKDMNQSTG